MKPIGTILRNARLQKGMNLEDVSKKTKIRVKYLSYIEQNAWDELPGTTYAKGFVKSYASAVGLDPDKIFMLFRREYKDTEKRELMPKGLVDQPLSPPGFVLTIKRILSKLTS